MGSRDGQNHHPRPAHPDPAGTQQGARGGVST
jgi:hypothetical protein